MIFSSNFKQFSRIILLVTAFLIIQPRQTKALEPITISILSGIAITTASGLLLGGIYKGIDILLTESKDQQDYNERHRKLKERSKEYFVDSLQLLKTNQYYKNAELKILSNHELYRYAHSIAKCI